MAGVDRAEEEEVIKNHTNPDLAPISPSQRTLSAYDMASLWVGLVTAVTTYYVVASLVQEGMSWWQGLLTLLAADLIILTTLILTAVPGTRFGIPFPILARSSFGIHGAHIATLLRSLVACGWFGIETWIGGQAIYVILPSSFKNSSFGVTISWLGTTPLELSCFFAFWAAQLAIIWKGMVGIQYMEKYSSPVLVCLTLSLLCWAYIKAGGFGRMLSLPSRLTKSEFWALFFPSLTACIGSWASVSLNIPDFSRYAKSQMDQVLGQVGMPLFMIAFAFVGLAVTSSTEVIFGHVISNPITLLGEIGGVFSKVIGMLGIVLAVLTTNIPANVVAPANALVNLSPSHFSFWRGALVTAVLGILFQPWRIFANTNSFVYTWLVGYSALLGPLGGIILTDYYLVCGMMLDVNALYSTSPLGRYYYCRGYNLRAVAALVIAILPVIPGFLHKVGILKACAGVLVLIYDNGWFFGFSSGGIIYLFLTCFRRQKKTAKAIEPLLLAPE